MLHKLPTDLFTYTIYTYTLEYDKLTLTSASVSKLSICIMQSVLYQNEPQRQIKQTIISKNYESTCEKMHCRIQSFKALSVCIWEQWSTLSYCQVSAIQASLITFIQLYYTSKQKQQAKKCSHQWSK